MAIGLEKARLAAACLLVLLVVASEGFAATFASPVDNSNKCFDKNPLDEYIQHYEPVHYDLDHFRQRHKRSTESRTRETFQMRFHAHGRLFNLHLQPDTSDLTNDAQIQILRPGSKNSTLEYNPSSFLTGYVEDDYKSFVSAWNDGGVMSANIHCSDGSYYLKPTSDHFSEPQPFHSIMYRSSDISPWPISMLKNKTLRAQLQNQSHCGSASNDGHGTSGHSHDVIHEDMKWREAHFSTDSPHTASSRQKRQAAGGRRYEKFVCTLSLYADYHFYSNRAGSDANRAISIMRQHVNKAINIFHVTDFDSNGSPDGFLFKIGRITVVTHANEPPFSGSTASYHSASASGNMESNVARTDWLRAFSAVEGNENFCEAVQFTYIDFPNGILGLAYLPHNGICARKLTLGTPFNFRGALYKHTTLNTAFVTFINHGIRQNDGLTETVFVHELGHNWGAEHDDQGSSRGKAECNPSDGNGNYLMFSRATDGTKTNNALFSPCSRSSINHNIIRIQKDEPDCFTNDPNAFCGNGIVEGSEECDCGLTSTCDDPCCNVYNVSTPNLNCRVRSGFSCSPRKGECCNSSCEFVSMENGSVPCGEAESCQIQPVCTNSSAECPTPASLPDNSLCIPDGTEKLDKTFRQACRNGFCGETACAAAGYKDCSCGAKSCQLCCLVDGQCVNTHQTPVTKGNLTLENVYISPGRACNNFNGQCTKAGLCVNVDSGDSETNLFGQETFNAILQWLKSNWFWVIVIVVAIVAIALVVHFTYKWKQKHSWSESKDLARNATKRIGKSLRGPNSRSQYSKELQEGFEPRKCARRLGKMFPMVGYEVLIAAANGVDNEEAAVVKLLDDGHKMCRW